MLLRLSGGPGRSGGSGRSGFALGAMVCGVVVVAFGPVNAARAHDSAQVGIRLDSASNRLVTREYFGSMFFGADDRVFGGDFSIVLGKAFGDEPGFGAPMGLLPEGQHLRVSITKPLQIWAGSLFVPFSARLRMEDPSGMEPTIISPTTPMDLGSAPSMNLHAHAGEMLHFHPDYYLTDSSGTRAAPNGIYLAEMVLTAPDSSIGASDPFWLVLNLGRPHAEHDEVKDWTRQNVVPTPAPAALVLALGLVAARRRR